MRQLTPRPLTPRQLAEQIREQQGSAGHRLIVGLTGAPGAGKSTLADELVELLGARSVVVPMDGFHLSQDVTRALGLMSKRGAPETFDAEGFVELLRRLRAAPETVVYAPRYRREIEDPIAAGISVTPDHDIVITEGNYLLLDQPPWDQVAELLDLSVHLYLPGEERVSRLVRRHATFGKTPEEAQAWASGSDETNAELVARLSRPADLDILLLAESDTEVAATTPGR